MLDISGQSITRKQSNRREQNKIRVDAVQMYKNIFANWINYQPTPQDVMDLKNKKKPVDEYYYQKYFKSALKKATELNLTFDKLAYKAITKMLSFQPYLNVSKDKNGGNYYKQLKNISSVSLRYIQKRQRLLMIADQLHEHKFITNRMFCHLLQLSSPHNSIQSKLENITKKAKQQLKHNSDQNINTNLISKKKNQLSRLSLQALQQIWEQYLPQYEIFHVWNNIILNHIEKMDRSLLSDLYFIYQPILQTKQYKQLSNKLKVIFQIENIDTSQLLQYIIFNDIYVNEKYYDSVNKNATVVKKQKFQNQLSQLYGNIQNGIKEIYPTMSVKFQLFGSARNGFKLDDSDVDITIFCKEKQRNPEDKPPQILKIIFQYLNTQKFKQYVLKNQHITRARVPVIKLQLNNKVIKSADIVLNNAHGIQNSKFLQKYSQCHQIKFFGLLIKKWAKSLNLIGPTKFSSYAIIFMVLYYLIKSNKLNPASRSIVQKKVQQTKIYRRGNRRREYEYKTKIQPYIQLNKQINLFNDFVNFLKFYSKNGEFFKTGETLCLIKSKIKIVQLKRVRSNKQPNQVSNKPENSTKSVSQGEKKQQIKQEGNKHKQSIQNDHGMQSEERQYLQQLYNCCNIHKKSYRSNYLINMHDPFDDSNPGRFSKQDEDQFFTCIDKTLILLQTNNNNFIMQIFNLSELQV